MTTNIKKIKDLINGAIEEDRKKRHAMHQWSFLVGLVGALMSFIPLSIFIGTSFSFISGIGAGFIYSFDIWLMYKFTRLRYKQAGE